MHATVRTTGRRKNGATSETYLTPQPTSAQHVQRSSAPRTEKSQLSQPSQRTTSYGSDSNDASHSPMICRPGHSEIFNVSTAPRMYIAPATVVPR